MRLLYLPKPHRPSYRNPFGSSAGLPDSFTTLSPLLHPFASSHRRKNGPRTSRSGRRRGAAAAGGACAAGRLPRARRRPQARRPRRRRRHHQKRGARLADTGVVAGLHFRVCTWAIEFGPRSWKAGRERERKRERKEKVKERSVFFSFFLSFPFSFLIPLFSFSFTALSQHTRLFISATSPMSTAAVSQRTRRAWEEWQKLTAAPSFFFLHSCLYPCATLRFPSAAPPPWPTAPQSLHCTRYFL